MTKKKSNYLRARPIDEISIAIALVALIKLRVDKAVKAVLSTEDDETTTEAIEVFSGIQEKSSYKVVPKWLLKGSYDQLYKYIQNNKDTYFVTDDSWTVDEVAKLNFKLEKAAKLYPSLANETEGLYNIHHGVIHSGIK